jgi:hypothetical protein
MSGRAGFARAAPAYKPAFSENEAKREVAMSWAQHLPKAAVDLVRGSVFAEYATVSAAGVPIDTPTYVFPSADLATLDIGTGLAYPAKAERARRNPKVGLLLEGGPSDPVVSIAGMAAVRDSDIQANLLRYTAETLFSPNTNPDLIPWETTRVAKRYYLARVIVATAPAHIRWWPNRAAMDEAPGEWRAPAGTLFPPSDPAPPGKPSEAPKWPQQSWQELREAALGSGLAGHLTLLDPDGFPIPLRVREIMTHAEGFSVVAPKGAPWREGSATLSFAGREVFVGEARIEGGQTILRVGRALPVLPTVNDPAAANTQARDTLFERLKVELDRRGLPIPVIPEAPPAPTEGALLRRPTYLAMTMSVGNTHYKEE